MLNSLVQFLLLILHSLRIGDNYLFFQKQRFQKIIYYLFLLWSLCIIISFIPSYFFLQKEIGDIKDNIKNDFPNFTINQYGITTEGSKTFIYTNTLKLLPPKKSVNSFPVFVFILDKENLFTPKDLTNFSHLIYVNDTSFLIKRGNLQEIKNNLKEIKNLKTISKSDLDQTINIVWIFTLGVTFLFVLFYSLTLHLGLAFALGFVSSKALKRKKMSFPETTKLSIYAFTPVVLLKTILNLFSLSMGILESYTLVIFCLLGIVYFVRAVAYAKQN